MHPFHLCRRLKEALCHKISQMGNVPISIVRRMHGWNVGVRLAFLCHDVRLPEDGSTLQKRTCTCIVSKFFDNLINYIKNEFNTFIATWL